MSAFVGENSSRLVSRGSSCHRTHDVTKGHMTRSVPSTTTLEKELSGCSKIVEIHTNADRCVHTDSAKAVDETILFSEKLQERANLVNEDRAVPTEPVPLRCKATEGKAKWIIVHKDDCKEESAQPDGETASQMISSIQSLPPRRGADDSKTRSKRHTRKYVLEQMCV